MKICLYVLNETCAGVNIKPMGQPLKNNSNNYINENCHLNILLYICHTTKYDKITCSEVTTKKWVTQIQKKSKDRVNISTKEWVRQIEKKRNTIANELCFGL